MKILRNILIGFAVLVAVVLVGIIIFLKTFDLNKFLPQITAQVSSVTGFPLTVAKADLGVSFAGVDLNIKGVSFGDTKLDVPLLVLVDSAHLHVDVMTLITRREINITGMHINQAQVNYADKALPAPLVVNIPDVEINLFLKEKITARFNAPAVHFQWFYALPPLSDLSMMVTADAKDARLESLSFNVAKGRILVTGDVKDYPKAQQLSANLTATNLSVAALIDPKIVPLEMNGRLEAKAKVSLAGFAPDHLIPSLKGDAQLEILDGSIEKLNILKMSLGKALSFIPGLAEQIDAILLGALKEKLGGDNTILEKAQAQLTLQDARINVDEALVETKAFTLNAKGVIGFDMNTDIQTVLKLTNSLSNDLEEQVKELGYLKDDQGRISIPAKISGVIPNLRYTPDIKMKDVAKNALIEEGGRQLDKVIEKNPEVGAILNGIFGGSKEGEASEDASSGGQETGGSKAKKAIGSLLGEILR